MKKAHVNTVSLGIFAWAKLEPEEGVYDFDWMEEIINRLYENGIYVFLATPSGARPHWLADRYPEVLRVNEMRQKISSDSVITIATHLRSIVRKYAR